MKNHKTAAPEKGPSHSSNEAIDLSDTDEKGQLSSPEVERFVESMLRMEKSKTGETNKTLTKRRSKRIKTESQPKKRRNSGIRKPTLTDVDGPTRDSEDVEEIEEIEDGAETEKMLDEDSKRGIEPEAAVALSSEAATESSDEEITIVEEKELLPRQLRRRRSLPLKVPKKDKKVKIADNVQVAEVKEEELFVENTSDTELSGVKEEEADGDEAVESELGSENEEGDAFNSESDQDTSYDGEDVKRRVNGSKKRALRGLTRNNVKEEVNPDSPIDIEDDSSSSEDDIMEDPAVIEIGSDSENEEIDEPRNIPHTTSEGPRSQIKLFSNFSHELSSTTPDPDINVDTVSIHDILGAEDLVETVQFNFNVDIDYFLTLLHPEFLKKRNKITFITGTPFLSTHPRKKELKEKCNIEEIIANLPNKFASHHTKMMVNFFAAGAVEIVISTANITQLDFNGLTQACWRSGKLYPGKTEGLTGKRFRLDLMRYLAKYKQDFTNKLLSKLDHLDYSEITVELVASAPGTYNVADIPKGDVYGFGKLRQVLERNNLLLDSEEGTHNILAQVTSLGYPFKSAKGETASVFSHILCPLFFKEWERDISPGAAAFEEHQTDFDYQPHIVFPTVDDIRHSNFGYMSGSAIHFKYKDTATHQAQYEQNIKPYLRRWNHSERTTGRELIPPHVKYYAVDNANAWKSLKWVLVGSHNLSKQAWGAPKVRSGGDVYDVSSYEVSVLIPGKEKPLVASFKRDTDKNPNREPVRFPFSLPPTPYGSHDKPWSPSADCGSKKDRWGNLHHGGFSL